MTCQLAAVCFDANVIEPGNNFLADRRFLGAVAGDGSQEAEYFCVLAPGGYRDGC